MSAEEGDLVATDGTPDDTNERRSGLMIVMIPDHCDDGTKRKGEELDTRITGTGRFNDWFRLWFSFAKENIEQIHGEGFVDTYYL
jgi:hypothetical protein